jgi:predicted NBD/HSP70 family sugar kinase
MASDDMLLIGVDGGATEIKAHAVACDPPSAPAAFRLRPEGASRLYPDAPDFQPLSVADQLRERDAGRPDLTSAESALGAQWVAAATEAIADVARQCGARRVGVGIGMPGLKTADGRGIAVINNGPRIPDYLDQLERGLAAAGLDLVAPIAALGSDADYCGMGEEHAEAGRFRDVDHAYYCGGGTGIADALKLDGRLLPMDLAKPWLMKSWQMPSVAGATFEKLVSASGLNRVYAELRSGTDRGDAFPEAAARAGDPIARAWLQAAALILAELLFERLVTIHSGRSAAPHRGAGYAKLDPQHPYRGRVLQRVIIGQRIGVIYADDAYRPFFGAPLDACLARLIAESDRHALAVCLAPDGTGLRPGFLQASRLRAAPAIGAAVAAMRAGRG